MTDKNSAVAKFQIIFSMIVFGTIALFVKNIPLSSGEIALYRAVIAALVIVFYKIILRKSIPFKQIRRDLPVLILSGAAMAFNWIFLFQAYKYTAVSVATLSYYFAPVVVMIMSPVLFRETITVKQLFCFLMATAGIIMVIGVNGIDYGSRNFTGISYGLGAALLYATVILLNKYIKSVSGIDRTLIQFIAAILVLVPYVMATSGINLSGLNKQGLINLLILGSIHTGVTYCLYFSSLKNLKGYQAALYSYIDPLIAITISVFVLHESMTVIQITGGVMILGFTLFNEVKIQPFRFTKKTVLK